LTTPTDRLERRSRRPIVLITPDVEPSPDGPSERRYAVRTNYAEAIVEAGGVALVLAYEPDQMDALLAIADGIVVTGTQPGADVPEMRLVFERALVDRALAAGKPLLGICHGMQMIGERLGGTVVRDLAEIDAAPGTHIPRTVADAAAHAILIEPDTDLARWSDGTAVDVNSLHRHALVGPGRFRVIARAPDGVIEAIEGSGGGFCVGVQWHPEYRLTPVDRALLSAFVARCAEAIGG
jgi:gamma-glutamyl-gamma-aminobutyrate hydrolase PuuD